MYVNRNISQCFMLNTHNCSIFLKSLVFFYQIVQVVPFFDHIVSNEINQLSSFLTHYNSTYNYN